MFEKQSITIHEKDEGIRLDRWFKRYYPQISHGILQKYLRKGDIRLDQKKSAANDRIQAGQILTIPSLLQNTFVKKVDENKNNFPEEKLEELKKSVLYKDKNILVLNKPAGIPVQGGSKIKYHIDGILGHLKFEADERPCLVHRLDKDTSGFLLLARSKKMAAQLTKYFKEKQIEKTYIAVLAGVPKKREGFITEPLIKQKGPWGEKVEIDHQQGRDAKTYYKVIDVVGKKACLVILKPITGRTHQLRVHCMSMGTPILGDGKYGGEMAFSLGKACSQKMHLHAREMTIYAQAVFSKKIIAPLPIHIKKTLDFLGLREDNAPDGTMM